MGYNTCYSLEVRTADNSAAHPNYRAIIKQLRDENEDAECSLDEEGGTLSDARWYDNDADLREFSKKFPDALLVLNGDGEGSDDFWIAYFKNGLMQIEPGRIEYDEFDERKLASG